MKPELVQAFMLKNGECFDIMAAQDVQTKLAEIDDSKSALLMSQHCQSGGIAIPVGKRGLYRGAGHAVP